MTPEFLPGPELGQVVRPMILQFFVLAILWIHLVAPASRGSESWTRVLLPFLMVSTGLLFFSVPLQPVWGSLLGPGGDRLPAIPASVARLSVLALNLGVLAWGLIHTGGVRRSPLVPLAAALPPALWLLEGGAGLPWVLGVGALGVVAAALAVRTPEPEGSGSAPYPLRPHPAVWRAGLGATISMLGLAAWLGAG